MSSLFSSVKIKNKIEECHNRKGKAIAFFPVGCTEQHGPLLPIQTDTIISEGVSSYLSDAIGDNHWGYVFPAISYSPTKSNTNYAGTVSVDEETLRQYIKQICNSTLGTGFDAIVLVSGHGPVDPSLNEISFNLVHEQYVKKNLVIKPVFVLSIYACRSILENKFGQQSGQHADWREFLYLLHILGNNYFDKKKIDELIAFQKENSFTIKKSPVFGVPMELRSVQGVMGDPIPISNGDWGDLARTAWEETTEHLTGLLRQKLNDFWDATLC